MRTINRRTAIPKQPARSSNDGHKASLITRKWLFNCLNYKLHPIQPTAYHNRPLMYSEGIHSIGGYAEEIYIWHNRIMFVGNCDVVVIPLNYTFRCQWLLFLMFFSVFPFSQHFFYDIFTTQRIHNTYNNTIYELLWMKIFYCHNNVDLWFRS